MSYLEGHIRQPTAKVDQEVAKANKVKTDVCQCLLVSAVKERCEMLSKAASKAGWRTVAFADPRNALVAFQRTKYQMALIDLDDDGSTPDGYRDLCESLSSASTRTLLAICGHEGEPNEEIWARQLGVEAYLPGVSLSQAAGVSWLCEQLRSLTTGPTGLKSKRPSAKT